MAKCDDTLETARKAETTEKLMSSQALTSPFAIYIANQPSGLIWIVIILFITKDFTQKWSQISLRTGVVTGTNCQLYCITT